MKKGQNSVYNARKLSIQTKPAIFAAAIASFMFIDEEGLDSDQRDKIINSREKTVRFPAGFINEKIPSVGLIWTLDSTSTRGFGAVVEAIEVMQVSVQL